MKYLNLTHFAATYDCNTYGSGSYNEAGACTTGTLTDTGQDVFLGIGVGVVLVVLAVVLFIRMRRNKTTN